MAKTKIAFLHSFLQSSGITAIAVVVIFVVCGTATLPQIFAATTYSVTGLKAVPTNDATYSANLSWSGTTPSHWIGESYKGSNTSVGSWSSTTTSKKITGLSCGVSYTFKVAAATSTGAAASAWASVSTSTKCPSVAWTSFTANGNTVNAAWHSTTFATEAYTLYVQVGSGAYSPTATSATSSNISGACGTTYNAYLTANAGGQTGPASATASVTTAACPPPPAPPSSPGPSTSGTSGGSSGGSQATNNSNNGGSSATSNTPSTPAAPDTPANFAANVVSQKIVQLTWGAAANADHYLLSRSTDSQNWTQIANITSTSYTDSSTSFSNTYYYELLAVSADGQQSGVANAQATTQTFKQSSQTITSDDNLASIAVPDGAINGNYSCTLSAGTERINLGKGQKVLAGPYDLLCVDDSGNVIKSFNQALNVTIRTSSSANGYTDLTAAVSGDKGWSVPKFDFNGKNKQISFQLTGAKSFAVLGTKQSNALGTVFLVSFLLLLLAAGVYMVLWLLRRRGQPSVQMAAQQQLTAEQEFQQALAAPNCTHLGMAQQVIPSSQGCLECEQQHTPWVSLRICLICGHVGCSDDSPQQHALRHYQETGHPLIYDFADPNGNSIGWCYVDQTYV